MSAEHYLNVRTRLSPRQPLIIDDCQELLGKPRRMVMFRSALDRRVRGGCPTMLSFTCDQAPKSGFVVIPQSKRWAKYGIEAPNFEERLQLVAHVAKQEQMTLSPILAQLLAKWLGGTGRGILGALHRLKLEQPIWTNSRDALRACGILDAYFSGNPNWDHPPPNHQNLNRLQTLIPQCRLRRYGQLHPYPDRLTWRALCSAVSC